MPNYLEYQKSISHELISIKDRLRNFIDDHHWPEDGRYKEIILTDILRKHLPKTVSVGTGFVMGETRVSTQVDIIVYRNDFPIMFQQADFVVVSPESVLGIIEVKSSLDDSHKLREAIEKTSEISRIVDGDIFSGIFAFRGSVNLRNGNLSAIVQTSLEHSHGKVNYLCVGQDTFIKYWPEHSPGQTNNTAHYSTYKMQDLSFGYFISNLVEDVHLKINGGMLPNALRRMFYPIEGTKETRKVGEISV